MPFFTMITVIAVVAMGILFVLKIISMALAHDERMQRIKHGYPLEDGKPADEFIDYTKPADQHRGNQN